MVPLQSLSEVCKLVLRDFTAKRYDVLSVGFSIHHKNRTITITITITLQDITLPTTVLNNSVSVIFQDIL